MKRTFINKIILLAGLTLLTATFAVAQTKPDALKAFRRGRNLEGVGRVADAQTQYKRAIQICKNEIKANPHNMDSYTVYTWALFRLKEYKETLSICNKALKIRSDPRIIQTRGEAYFYLNNYSKSLANMELYVSQQPYGERVSVAYFYMGEIYRLTNRFHKADIAYSHAVHLESGISLWWFRLGLAREHAGEKAAALRAYKRAVRLRPDYQKALDAIKRLS